MCSRKDYVSVAKALKAQRDSYQPSWNPNLFRALDDSVKAIAQVFANDNPRFDYGKFYTACGMVQP